MKIVAEAGLEDGADGETILAGKRHQQPREPVRGAFAARLDAGAFVNSEPLGEDGEGIHRAAGKNRITVGSGVGEGLDAVGGKADWRMGSLEGLGNDLDILDLEMAAAEGEAILGLRRAHHLQSLL